MNNRLTPRERIHVGKVKELACAVCGAPGPSDAHHVRQHCQFLVLPLCKDCHQGSLNGIHGQGRMWSVMKMDELKALNETIRALYG